MSSNKKILSLYNFNFLTDRLNYVNMILLINNYFNYMKNNNSTAIATISTPLFEDLKQLISEGNLDEIKNLIDANPDLLNKAQPFTGETAFHYAALKGNKEVVEYLIEEKKVDITQTNTKSQTALHYAAANGHLEVVKYLIEEKGAFVNQLDSFNRNSLYMAAEKGSLEVVKYLIDEKGADTNQADLAEMQPLYRAAENHHKDVVTYLIEKKGVDINQAFHLALQNKNMDVAELLLPQVSHDEIVKIATDPLLTMAMKNFMGKLKHKVTTSSDISTDDHNEVEMESSEEEVASTNFVSSTGDVFTNIIGGVENLIIEDTDVVVMGDFGTEG